MGDSEGIINVVQGIVLSDNSSLTAAQVTAWVAGATAGASITTSNTGMVYTGAIDVDPRMTKAEMEAAVKAGKFIFKVDRSQNVTVVYDINSLTSVTVKKGKVFTKNRVIRTLDNIANDITTIFESNYVGKVNNNAEGRSLLKAALVDYFNTLQNMGAIQNFETDDVTIIAGTESDAVVVDANIQPVDSIEKIYVTVNLAFTRSDEPGDLYKNTFKMTWSKGDWKAVIPADGKSEVEEISSITNAGMVSRIF